MLFLKTAKSNWFLICFGGSHSEKRANRPGLYQPWRHSASGASAGTPLFGNAVGPPSVGSGGGGGFGGGFPPPPGNPGLPGGFPLFSWGCTSAPDPPLGPPVGGAPAPVNPAQQAERDARRCRRPFAKLQLPGLDRPADAIIAWRHWTDAVMLNVRSWCDGAGAHWAACLHMATQQWI